MVEKDGNLSVRSAERARFAQCTDLVDIVVVQAEPPLLSWNCRTVVSEANPVSISSLFHRSC